jgi:WD40 repeat protein
MYFFHPIQQCAQQIYYTALPLSPTSSHLHKFYLRRVVANQLPRVAAFSGAPSTWGLLLRTINVGSGQLTCIATSAQRVIAACGNVVNIYDAVTFVLQQSLRTPGAVSKIRDTPDESTLFFAHSHSITMWDVQTGGHTHTFTTQSEITDIAVSTTGDRIACGLSENFVAFWDIRTKEEGTGFWNTHATGEGKFFRKSQRVVTVRWSTPLELKFETQSAIYYHNVSRPLETIREQKPRTTNDPTHLERLFVGEELVRITPPSGVQLFNSTSRKWTSNLPLLDAATSLAVSLNRNLVAQTKDSIQIFPLDVLKSSGGEARNNVRTSHVYPLGGKHIICLLQPNRRLTILEQETLRKLHPGDTTSLIRLLSTDKSPHSRASLTRGFIAEFGISVVMQAWRSGTSLPEWTEAAGDDLPLSGVSPSCARIATFYSSPRRELRVKNIKSGAILASLPLEHSDLGTGNVYDVAFDSGTTFHLKINGPDSQDVQDEPESQHTQDGPGSQHVQIPYEIIASPSGHYSHKIVKGKPVRLSKTLAPPPYALDANCEWVVDAKSRKVCWIPPSNIRRGDGGHFWAGLSLVMVGDDGVVRKLTFKELDC